MVEKTKKCATLAGGRSCLFRKIEDRGAALAAAAAEEEEEELCRRRRRSVVQRLQMLRLMVDSVEEQASCQLPSL